MNPEELKGMYMDLLYKAEYKYCMADYMTVWKDNCYGCLKWIEVRELIEEVKDIYYKKSGRYFVKVKIKRSKNKVVYNCYSYEVTLLGKYPRQKRKTTEAHTVL